MDTYGNRNALDAIANNTARFASTEVTYVIQENLVIELAGTTNLTVMESWRARPTGRLVIQKSLSLLYW